MELRRAGFCTKVCRTFLRLGKQNSVERLYKNSTSCSDDLHFTKKKIGQCWKIIERCSQIVLTCQYLARIGRPDMLWTMDHLAMSLTKWNRACDGRLPRLTRYIRHTGNYRQNCHVGNNASECKLGLFHDADVAGDL